MAACEQVWCLRSIPATWIEPANHWAPRHNNIVAMLLAAGASADKQNRWGKSAMIFAVQNNHIATVRALLTAKPRSTIDSVEKVSKLAPLNHALQYLIREMHHDI